MRKFFIVLFYSVYLFFLLGLILHTSAHPQFIGKYTIKYAVLLVLLLLFFPFFLWILIFLSKTTSFKFHKKKIVFTPIKKVLLFILVIFLLVILLIELFIRYKYRNFESNTYQYTLDNFDPFLQLKLAKNYTTEVNSYGFRGEEISKKKPTGTYRIFVLGGSTVLSRTTSYEKTATGILEKLLQAHFPNKKIEVINAGEDGYTSEHSLIQYLFKIKDFDPDMIIMWHGINDLNYSCNSQERTYGTFLSDYSNYLGADASMAFEHFRPGPLISIKFLTYDFVIKFLQDNLYSDIFHASQKNHPFPGIYTAHTISQQFDMNSYPSLDSYKRNIQSLINTTKDDHVSLILGDQPNLYRDEIGKEELRKINFPAIDCSVNGKYPSLQSYTKGMTLFNSTTQQVADENNIPFVDLAGAVPKTVLYFTDDVHFTDKGNEKVAETLYKFILSKGLIE